ncbi:MAG: ferritin family protein [Gammaproteobacteria bacterium]|nr:ferritin family protein [Gammaproteobacteria bacterium]MBT8110608.1 ferritin family protein [Gammaproteobacteria bacterium]NND46737.1 ferritin family protein [Woeseiaceae bacterium]NNL45308.1 ferritin family protein [Woeseiaceae bacterium]
MQYRQSLDDVSGTPPCNLSIAELLLHALVIEREAMHRYTELANMMAQIGNKKVSRIFSKMSGIEAKHAESIERQIEGQKLPVLTPSQYTWHGPEAPENTDSNRLFHLMTPCQALELALKNEKRAYEFYSDVVDDSTDERVREMASDFAGEEEQHVAWVEEWLAEVRPADKD